ncbi:MAG: hypothetical protein RIC35_02455 [Marinoscillum sp.]
MLKHEYDEQFKELANFISTHTIDKGINNKEKDALESDLSWNASLFFAKAIHLAGLRKQELALKEFNQFKKAYENRNGIQINTDALFQKFWLRDVLGKIKIAGTVSSACSRFNKISEFRQELQFLFEKFPEGQEGKDKLPKEDFDQIRVQYEKENNFTLSNDGLFKPSWLSESDGLIDVSNINFYFKPYLEHWEEFEFLSAYQKELSIGEDKGLKIKERDLKKLHQSFKSFYPKTPPLKVLVSQKVLKLKDGFYYLNFCNTDVRYWSALGDQIAAHYWQLLIEDDNFQDDHERVKTLLRQILHHNWPADFLDYSLDEAKKRFLDAGFYLVLNEQDLSGIESEYKKISIDADFGSSEVQMLFHSRAEFDDYSLNNTDHFELLESLNHWEKKANTTYLHGQSSRRELSFITKVIVAHDYELERIETDDPDNPIIDRYKRIISLLDGSITKPTLLWYMHCDIIMSRRGFIPYLIENPKYTSLAFQRIDQLVSEDRVLTEEKDLIHKKLWVKSLELALYTIRSTVKNGDAAKVVFQIYRQINTKKYDIPYNRQEHIEKLSRSRREEKEEAVLSLIEDSLLYNHSVHGGGDQYLIPVLFNELVELFIGLPSRSFHNNGTINFPMLQWDGLTWLMKCSTYWKYKSQFETTSPNIHILTNSFFKLYIDRIEIKEIEKYNFFEKKEEKGLPLWSEKIERLESIEWIYPIYFIYKQQKLNGFLEPRFYFDTTTDRYHKENQFTADKLRTHIGVLLQVLRQLMQPKIPYGFEKDDFQEITSRIEQQIIDFLKSHIEDKPQEGRVDLFDYNKEKGFKNSEKEALLPQIARALNWFSKKEQLIDVILNSQNIIKILTVAEWITSEGIKQKLIEKIQQSDIKAFLEDAHWIPEVQQVLLEIRQYPQLINEINQTVEFWESKISKKSNEYEVQLYQTRMLLAYFKQDEQELNDIKEPKKSTVHRVRELSYGDHKQFYRALIRLEKNPKSSYDIFKQLSTQYPQYPVFALNQMAAKISIAKADNDNPSLYTEALEEWKVYVSKQENLGEETLGSTFSTNRLLILLKLGKHDDLDTFFNKLDMPYQMLPDVLEVKIESLVEREKIEEALNLLEKAERYHSFSDLENIGFIRDLQDKIGGIDNIDELHYHYNRIFNSSPTKLIKIFPEKLNGRNDLTEFIVSEVALAASSMLNKINALPAILDLKNTSKENRYNDLIQLALEARISAWGWSVKDQTRKAFSHSATDLGEIDLDIRDSNQNSFVTCEAFILRDITRVKSHLKKVISHYTHERKAFLTLVYFTGKQADFQKEWTKYQSKTLTGIIYPKGFELENKKVFDVSAEFGRDYSGVRIGKSVHINGVVIYSLFISLNYKLI